MTAITNYVCDIDKCGRPANTKETFLFQIIFLIDQTEGRSVSPYLTRGQLHICKECLSLVLGGKAIFAHGAQGNNTYYFKEENK